MIRIQESDFDAGEEIDALHEDNFSVGAVCSFVGLVRDFQENAEDENRITALTLEHYPGMTLKKLSEIEQKARARWPLEAVRIIHRYGRLEAGERIVFVGAASPHRAAAFEACQFMMDYLKTEAPFWKKTEDETGESDWVDAREQDESAKNKWQ